MAKYIETDLLRKEIERRREANKRQYHSSAGGMSWQRMCGEEDCLVELLAFLDSLQQELPEEPDKSLEEEVKNYFQGYWPGIDTPEQCNTDLHFTPPAILRLISHFINWQKEQMMKGAVEADVNTYKDPVLNSGWVEFVVDMPSSETDKFGDKVRIIVLPKED